VPSKGSASARWLSSDHSPTNGAAADSFGPGGSGEAAVPSSGDHGVGTGLGLRHPDGTVRVDNPMRAGTGTGSGSGTVTRSARQLQPQSQANLLNYSRGSVGGPGGVMMIRTPSSAANHASNKSGRALHAADAAVVHNPISAAVDASAAAARASAAAAAFMDPTRSRTVTADQDPIMPGML
jgi:hypothetical protein